MTANDDYTDEEIRAAAERSNEAVKKFLTLAAEATVMVEDRQERPEWIAERLDLMDTWVPPELKRLFYWGAEPAIYSCQRCGAMTEAPTIHVKFHRQLHAQLIINAFLIQHESQRTSVLGATVGRLLDFFQQET